MKTITLLQPPRIVFGDGCAGQCAELLAQRGVRRVLLVTSSRIETGFLTLSLVEAGCEVVSIGPIDCEPTLTMFSEALVAARAGNVDAVVGMGGGSVIDVAKLLAALIPGGQDVKDVFGINLLQRRGLLLCCLPTTAGTGAEVSPNAILLDEADDLKKGVVSPHLVPDVALVDPQLTLSVPPSVTAATGLDALTHCIEAYTNKFAHPMVDVYALQGIRLISANLLRAVTHGVDVEARGRLALGSLYGGLCLGPVNTAAVHALAYPLGGRFHVAHGVSNAVLLPEVIRFNLPSAMDRYAEVACALGVEAGPDDPPEQAARRGVDALVELSKACGVPQRLSELGVPREAIPSMARAALQVTRLLRNNPRPLEERDAVQIYEASY